MLRTTRPCGLFLLLLLLLSNGFNCAIEKDPNPCCLKPDHSVALTTRSACDTAGGLDLSKEACSNKEKILEGLCQRYTGFCFQSHGSCVTDWKNKLKANPPWYDVNVCMQQNLAGGSFDCVKGRQCFEKLQKGVDEVTIKGPDGSFFSSAVKVQSTSQTVELTVTLNDSNSLLITFHSKPLSVKEYTLANNNSQDATVVYTDKGGTQHTSFSGRIVITKIDSNKATGTFKFQNQQNQGYEGILTETPIQ